MDIDNGPINDEGAFAPPVVFNLSTEMYSIRSPSAGDMEEPLLTPFDHLPNGDKPIDFDNQSIPCDRVIDPITDSHPLAACPSLSSASTKRLPEATPPPDLLPLSRSVSRASTTQSSSTPRHFVPTIPPKIQKAVSVELIGEKPPQAVSCRVPRRPLATLLSTAAPLSPSSRYNERVLIPSKQIQQPALDVKQDDLLSELDIFKLQFAKLDAAIRLDEAGFEPGRHSENDGAYYANIYRYMVKGYTQEIKELQAEVTAGKQYQMEMALKCETPLARVPSNVPGSIGIVTAEHHVQQIELLKKRLAAKHQLEISKLQIANQAELLRLHAIVEDDDPVLIKEEEEQVMQSLVDNYPAKDKQTKGARRYREERLDSKIAALKKLEKTDLFLVRRRRYYLRKEIKILELQIQNDKKITSYVVAQKDDLMEARRKDIAEYRQKERSKKSKEDYYANARDAVVFGTSVAGDGFGTCNTASDSKPSPYLSPSMVAPLFDFAAARTAAAAPTYTIPRQSSASNKRKREPTSQFVEDEADEKSGDEESEVASSEPDHGSNDDDDDDSSE